MHLVDLSRHAFQFHRQAAGRFVHQVDRLVGQESIGDVSVGKFSGGDQRRVLDLHPFVMGFVAGLETTQDGDRVFDVRLADKDRLETPLQGSIFFDVFAILVEGRCANAAQFAAGERRFEQIRGVVAALGSAGTDDGVQFVDEQNHLALGIFHFAQHRLEPLFELAAKFCASDQGTHVEGDHPFVFEALGHVALDNPQSQTLGDGRFADARLADQHRIVLGPPRKDLDHPANFLIATNDRIELALFGPGNQIDAVFFQGLKFRFGVSGRSPGQCRALRGGP